MWTRRDFTRRVGSLALFSPLLGTVGCNQEDSSEPGVGQIRLATLDRPILLPWEDRVRIDAQLDELPMAYVSMGRREVFVDFDFRDRSNWILDAHISVSTGLWRIPLPGDPPDMYIQPGDLEREFTELDMAEWDPTMTPAVGDFRIRRGRAASVTIDFDCEPVGGTGSFCSGGPWESMWCQPGGEEACREDFLELGVARRHTIRGCFSDEGVEVPVMGWTAVS